MTGLALRPYQQEGREFLVRAGRALLADEPGLGKTPQLLCGATGRTLVVTPAILEDQWWDERDRWAPDLDMTWVSYSSLCERVADKKGRLTVPVTRPWPKYRGPWDTVIFDEAHYLKGRNTRWTEAAEMIQADQMFMATGTPLVNWAHEIFKPLQLIYPDRAKPGKELGNYWKWVARYFETEPGRFGKHQIEIGGLHPGWTWEEFGERNGLAGRWLRRERDEVLKDLPPLTTQTIEVAMTSAQEQVYKRLKKDLYARIEETGHEIISWSEGGIWVKLLKLTTGIEVEDPNSTQEGAKISAVRALLQDRTRPTLVFCTFRASAERLAAAIRRDNKSVGVISGEYTVPDRKATARRFQAGEIEVLVGTLASISEGLNLHAADTCIFVERDPRPSKNEQAVGRIRRMGQTHPCLAIDLVVKNTVDANLVKWIKGKTDHQAAAMRGFDAIQLI